MTEVSPVDKRSGAAHDQRESCGRPKGVLWIPVHDHALFLQVLADLACDHFLGHAD